MMDYKAPSRDNPESHQRGATKLARIPIKVAPQTTRLKKPEWIRTRLTSNPRVQEIKRLMRELNLSSVCEEAGCPNLGECFSHGTATFMIMGISALDVVPFAMLRMANRIHLMSRSQRTWLRPLASWG